MPYYIQKAGQRKYVVRKLSGKAVGRTTSREKAQAMIRAIYANEHSGKRRGR